ncbi:OTU domain [Trinorchestia longiramus]|nr:OTU domain [Trinorchestia longiramus]
MCRLDRKLNRGLSKGPDNAAVVCKARNELTQVGVGTVSSRRWVLGQWAHAGGCWDSGLTQVGAGTVGSRSLSVGDTPHLMLSSLSVGDTPHLMLSSLSVGDTPHLMLSSLSVGDTPYLMLSSLSVANFRWFVERDLIEVSTLHSLESSGRLNWWWGPCRRLWPLATTGDGNCLLHAASLGMWGFHDRLLSLRSALHDFLTTSVYASALWRRWRYHTALANAATGECCHVALANAATGECCHVALANAATGLVFSDAEWATEWANVLRLSSTAPRNNNNNNNNHNNNNSESYNYDNSNKVTISPGSPPAGVEHSLGGRMSSPSTASQRPGSKRLSNGLEESNGSGSSSAGAVYESLEEIHIFALAHVLRRPIIVVADLTLKDVHGAPLSPIPFGGVYLPLQHSPSQCQVSPLLLTYDAAHFSALVVMEETGDSVPPAVIPLTTNQHRLLPLHFAVDPGEDWTPGWAGGGEPVPVDQLLLTDTEKLQLLKTYLQVVQVPIPRDFNEYHEFEYEPPERGYSPSPYAGEKKSSESSGESDDPSCTCEQSVQGGHLAAPGQGSKTCPRHSSKFGTLGRSVSKKIKSLKKMRRPNSFRKKDDGDGMSARRKTRMGGSLRRRASSRRPYSSQDYILAAAIQTEKRMAFQEKMVNNYLTSARRRFQEMQESKKRTQEAEDTRKSTTQTGAVKLSPVGSKNGGFGKADVLQLEVTDGGNGEESPVACINSGCEKSATASTAYLCLACYARQKDGEMELDRRKRSDDSSPRENSAEVSPERERSGEATSEVVGGTPRPKSLDGPQYGAGRSQFYTELSPNSVSKSATMPSSLSPSSSHPSALFLSNSTFYGGSSGKENPNPNSNKDSRNSNGPVRGGLGRLPPAGGKPRPGKRDQSSSRHDSNSSGSEQISATATNSRISEDNVTNNGIPQNNSRTSQSNDSKQSRVQPHYSKGVPNNNSKNTRSKQPIKITDRKARVEGTGAGVPTPCRKRGCEFFGSEIFNGYCSKCAADQN